MSKEYFLIDTWLKTFALKPESKRAWVNSVKSGKSERIFTLEKNETTTGRVEMLALW